jgi:hypothetical protein
VPIALELPARWGAYGAETAQLADLLAHGFATTLAHAGRRDLVIELLGSLVLVYPASHDVAGPDAYADLTETALAIADAVIATTRPQSPRGVEAREA